MPPMSACDEDEGRPKYQVSRFHAIAPMSPEKTIGRVITFGSTMPLAIVAATASDRNAPRKFSDAASATAMRGPSARVEIIVAIALAVSWKPFVKSNARPTAITTISSVISRHRSAFAPARASRAPRKADDAGATLRGPAARVRTRPYCPRAAGR
jgi:hypothetical protein